MSEQQKKRELVLELLCTRLAPKAIAEQVGVTERMVLNIKKAIQAGNGIKSKAGSGGHNKKRFPTFVRAMKAKITITKDPTTSIRRLAKDMEVAPSMASLVMHQDLGLKSYARTPRHLLTKSMKARRLTRCKKVLSFLKNHGSIVKIYSDKKIFTVDAVVNRRNDRFIAKSVKEVKGVYRTKHPAQVMVLGVVASDGKRMPPYFFKTREKIGTEAYYKVLRFTVLPCLKTNYPMGNYVWTQDSAPAHTAKRVQNLCWANFADFWPANMWPALSLDLNPLDFAMWGQFGEGDQ